LLSKRGTSEVKPYLFYHSIWQLATVFFAILLLKRVDLNKKQGLIK